MLPMEGGLRPNLRATHPGGVALIGDMPTTAGLVAGILVLGVLYLARELLVPVAIAILLSFVLAPLVTLLERWGFHSALAVAVVTLLACLSVVAAGALIGVQIQQLADDLPRYQANLSEKIHNVRVLAGSRTLERLSEVVTSVSKEIEEPSSESRQEKPIPVEVRPPNAGTVQTLLGVLRSLSAPLTGAGIVLVFIVFILAQRRDLRNRLIRLAGARDLQRTTSAFDDAGQRLSRLLLAQLGLNAGFGMIIGLGLWAIGVPSAALWGAMAAILRFVPYIGALIAAILPVVTAAAVGPDWTMAGFTIVLFLVVEPLVGQVVEPLLYGHSSGLSPFSVIVAATFWTWLWGPVGLVLSTPLTVCLVVVARHVERLRFIDVMFGDEPPLTPPELAYQRMLARDPVEVSDQAEAYLEDHSLVEYYDDILLESLKLAQHDADRDALAGDRLQGIREAVAEVVEDLASHEDLPAASHTGVEEQNAADTKTDVGATTAQAARKVVVCLPTGGDLGEAAALVLAQLIERRGLTAQVEPSGALSMSRILGWSADDAALICVCYLQRVTPAQVHYSIRRIRRKEQKTPILLVLLGDASSAIDTDAVPDVAIVKETFGAAIARVVEMAAAVTLQTGGGDRSAPPDDALPELKSTEAAGSPMRAAAS